MGRSSRISGFYNLTPIERRHIVADWAALTPEQAASVVELLAAPGGLTLEQADKMVENVVGTYALPLGIATNFVVNGRDVLVPMVIEEPSVVAGASFAARLARAGGGFHAETTEPLMIGQIQVLDLADAPAAAAKVAGAEAAAASTWPTAPTRSSSACTAARATSKCACCPRARSARCWSCT